jgi:hypothetical protein
MFPIVGEMADEAFVYAKVADQDNDGFITENEMKAGWTFGLAACKAAHKIHEDMASDGGCLGEDGIDINNFMMCLYDMLGILH